jgi:hypothetical protein
MTSRFHLRIDRMERAMQSRPATIARLAECICFDRAPFFFYEAVREIALRVPCSVHGQRTAKEASYNTLDDQRREWETGCWWPRDSEDYRRAWNASFKNGPWPVEEIELNGRSWLLPRNERGELLDWKNASALPPWKMISARTIESLEITTNPSPRTRSMQLSELRDFEAEAILEEFGCKNY